MIRSICTDVERRPQHAVNKTSIKPYVQQRKKKRTKQKQKPKHYLKNNVNTCIENSPE